MPGSYCSSVDGSAAEEEVASSTDASCMVFLLDGNATQIPVQVHRDCSSNITLTATVLIAEENESS